MRFSDYLVCILCPVVVHGFFISTKKEGPSTNLQDIHFLLWTRKNQAVVHELVPDDITALHNSGYDGRLPTTMYVHGYRQQGRNVHSLRMRTQMLRHHNCNFISVDWSKLAKGSTPFYPLVVANTHIVGKQIAKLIDFLVRHGGASLSNFHLIGFSLGAHIVGIAGANLNGLLPRITGLDPAFPGFSIDNLNRLDTTDAAFVDVIHTNSGTLLEGFSFPQPLGHVDFYVNGGHFQPGCKLGKAQLLFGVLWEEATKTCSHVRASQYFIESINSPIGFSSVRCDSWEKFASSECDDGSRTLMGFPVSTDARGTYFLSTNPLPPYAKG